MALLSGCQEAWVFGGHLTQGMGAELDECKNNTSKKLQWVERFKAFENIDKIDRNVVVQLIECIHIYDKTHLQITFNFKDEYEQALSALKEYVEVV